MVISATVPLLPSSCTWLFSSSVRDYFSLDVKTGAYAAMFKLVRRVILLSFAAFCLLPYVWTAGTAFKARLDITASPPKLLWKPTLENFATSYNGQGIVPLVLNTLIIDRK